MANNINQINLNHSQLNNIRNNIFFGNNNFNNSHINKDIFNLPFEYQIYDNNNSNNKDRIINQNCYQINIEKLNIHNQINNINQNYNINTLNEKDLTERSIKSNESKNSKKSYHSKENNQNMNLNYLINNLEKLTESQSGCRLLQNKIQQNPFYANNLYQAIKIKLNLKLLSIDSFGNYLVQKLLEYISDELIQDYFNNVIYPSFMEVALNPHGSRVIQKLFGRIYVYQDIINKFNECLQNWMLEIFLKFIQILRYNNSICHFIF